MTTMTTRAKRAQIPEIEEKIEARIAADNELYDLDQYDIQEIRDEIYSDYGFNGDPFHEEEDEEFNDDYGGASYMRAKLLDIGMTARDFF